MLFVANFIYAIGVQNIYYDLWWYGIAFPTSSLDATLHGIIYDELTRQQEQCCFAPASCQSESLLSREKEKYCP